MDYITAPSNPWGPIALCILLALAVASLVIPLILRKKFTDPLDSEDKKFLYPMVGIGTVAVLMLIVSAATSTGWMSGVTASISGHYGVRITSAQVIELDYPRVRPGEATTFGTTKIDGKSATLLWDGDRMSLVELKPDGEAVPFEARG